MTTVRLFRAQRPLHSLPLFCNNNRNTRFATAPTIAPHFPGGSPLQWFAVPFGATDHGTMARRISSSRTTIVTPPSRNIHVPKSTPSDTRLFTGHASISARSSLPAAAAPTPRGVDPSPRAPPTPPAWSPLPSPTPAEPSPRPSPSRAPAPPPRARALPPLEPLLPRLPPPFPSPSQT